MATESKARRIYRKADIARRASVSLQTITAWERAGRIPPGRRITKRCVLWDGDEIDRVLVGSRDVATLEAVG